MVGANILSPGYSVPYGLTPKDPGFALVADQAFNDRAHALGLKVIPWTINDADTMRAQITVGADGIITDHPTRLRAVMADLGMPLPPGIPPRQLTEAHGSARCHSVGRCSATPSSSARREMTRIVTSRSSPA